MSTALVTASFDRTVKLQEIKDRLSEINLCQALGHVTKLASRQLWFPESDAVAARVNLLNLAFLAKAVVLYCSDDGRPMDTSDAESGDLRWLLTAINTMKWYSDAEYASDIDEAITSSLIRQAYVRNFVGDHPVASIARAYAMFHEILPQVNRGRVDIDASMVAVTGVTCGELWVLTSAIYTFYFIECAAENGPWVFTSDFFADAPNQDELADTLNRVLARIAKTPEEIRAIYARVKYHNPSLPDEYWLSEFNILRDYPIVHLPNEAYCCPYPVLAWMRGAVGYYFDLVTYYADIERVERPKNKNPFNNVMSHVLGEVFQEYVGKQLQAIVSSEEYLEPEITYHIGKEELRSPDWMLRRLPDLPVLFECKARRPALQMQARCNKPDREAEIDSVLAGALGQLTVFLNNVTTGKVPGFTLAGDWRLIYALVLYESFPYHALPSVPGPKWRKQFGAPSLLLLTSAGSGR